MVYRRKKNNKSRKILRRIRKNKVPKKFKREIKRQLFKQVESKFASTDQLNSYTLSGTIWNTTVQNLLTIYPDVQEGVQRHERLGNAIQIKKFRVAINLYMPTSGTGSAAEWAYRIILWKPKILSDISAGQSDMIATFGSQGREAMEKAFWNSEDVTVIKDTHKICMPTPSVFGKGVAKHVFYIPAHKLLYATNSATQPTDRSYQISIILMSGVSLAPLTVSVRSDIMYKDP